MSDLRMGSMLIDTWATDDGTMGGFNAWYFRLEENEAPTEELKEEILMVIQEDTDLKPATSYMIYYEYEQDGEKQKLTGVELFIRELVIKVRE